MALLVLAPLVAEYLLGNVPFADLPLLPFLAPMYGGAALVIRESARRTGRGWPTMILLAAAYGLFQPAVLDQSLFNPSFEGHDFQSAAHVPGLDISAYYGMIFVVGHTIWSICIPIALVEEAVTERRTTPWLRPVGLIAAAATFVLGAAVIFSDHQTQEAFSAPLLKVLGASAVCAVVAGAAFAVGGPPRPQIDRAAPSPRRVGVAAFLASSLYIMVPESWLGVAPALVLVAASAVVIGRWTRRDGWSAPHRFALAAGALLTYAWLGFVVLPLNETATILNLLGQLGLVAVAIASLVALARRVLRRAQERGPVAGAGAGSARL